ncbi:uncharacterized protein B4U80_11051 [Leptotrombidium deliense]|uniref:ISXO2-like transposase domain-containing protein n=1 Tax=Leptotrombidium deliense TaxID=299467 RepID=A0A443S2D4_9ACAR|nr:uncharacterized protein B4U80_11051 [Leptotrombidium deliense]
MLANEGVKDGCGQRSPTPLITGEFGHIRQKATNCTYIVGNSNRYNLATITFTKVSLYENDYFVLYDENGTVAHGPYFGTRDAFAILTNKKLLIDLIIDDEEKYHGREFRGYVKTFNYIVNPVSDVQKTGNQTFCGINVNRRKRSPPTSCRYVILKDIIEWNMQTQLVEKFREWNVIPKDGEIDCADDYCDGKLFLGKDASRPDGYIWRCGAKHQDMHRKQVYCKVRQPLRQHTFFFKSKLKLWQIAAFANLWIRKVPLWIIEEQTMISHKIAVAWSGFCREVAFDALMNVRQKLGGLGKVVEIDESKFGKRKYDKGHYVEGAWVFGGIERDSGEIFMEVVPDRTKETLLPLIDKWIEKGSTIYSDQWSSYRTLKLRGYTHMTVNHKNYFKDPETGVHTNSIESIWGHAKASVSERGRKAEFLGGYLARRAAAKHQDPMVLFFNYARLLLKSKPAVDIEDTEEDEKDISETKGAEGGSGGSYTLG